MCSWETDLRAVRSRERPVRGQHPPEEAALSLAALYASPMGDWAVMMGPYPGEVALGSRALAGPGGARA